MSLSTPGSSSRYHRSLSSLLWDGYNSISPVILSEDDDEQFQRERRYERQLTLDKLEGRIKADSGGYMGFEDPALNDVCGLKSILSGNHADTSDNDPGAASNGPGDPAGHKAVEDWAAGVMEELSPEPGGHDWGGFHCDDNSESDGVRSMVTGGVSTVVSGDITHPAFSCLPDAGDKWEATSRISEDSFFDGHTRYPPESKPNGVHKAAERLSTSSPGAMAISPYRDSLCSNILGGSWPKTPVGHVSSEDVPYVGGSRAAEVGESSQSNEPRVVSFIAPFDPRSTTLTPIVFQGKRSFMKRIVEIIAQPMKMLTSRKKKKVKLPPDLFKEIAASAESGNPSNMHAGNSEFVSSYPSGNRQSAGRRVVFSDTVGYRVFHQDSPCVGDH